MEQNHSPGHHLLRTCHRMRSCMSFRKVNSDKIGEMARSVELHEKAAEFGLPIITIKELQELAKTMK